MWYAKTQAKPLQSPEVVLNLWVYAGEHGHVMRIAGKAYVMDGRDQDKLALLRRLSATDFLSAAWQQVPPNFTLANENGEKMKGVAHASMVSDPKVFGSLFGPLMERLATELPEQARSNNGNYESFRLQLPQEPLTVTTVIMENEDGSLVPMVSNE